VADQDIAIIFVDDDDTEDEQRATVAHEAAHFLRHYREPRERVRRLLGPSIDDVLNRRRPPTSAERLAAVMRGVPLTCYRCGEPHYRAPLLRSAQDTEDEADEIALELLIPHREIQRRRLNDPNIVSRQYGLPLRLAELAFGPARPTHHSPRLLDIFRVRTRAT
jgi:hypothetical protein